MAEVIIALGVISSVICCIDMGSKVADRLEYYLSRTKSPPQIFVTLCDTIPLLTTTFVQVKDACDNGALDLESQKRLTKTVEGCRRLVTALEDHLQECLPAEGDSFAQKTMKAIKSIRSEKAIGDIQRNLEARQRATHSVFWVDATNSGTAYRSFENIASKLAPGANYPTPQAARGYVLKALESLADPLLLVFDTFDQPDEFTTVRDFFPYGAKIILTSRHNESKRLGSSIEVEAMSENEGIELLLHQAALQKTPDNLEHARAITQKLGGLALAIDQVATYLNARHMPLHTFSEVYEKRRAAILKHTPTQWEYRKARGKETEKSVSVFTTWEMSFEQLKAAVQERDSIVRLLTLTAFINTNNVSEGLFSLYSQQANRPDWLDAFMDGGAWDSDKYQDCIVHLHSIALVTTIDLMADDARISFHPLVAEWLKLRIDQCARAQYVEEAIRIVRLFVDNGDKKEMPTQDKIEILGHIDKITEHEKVFRTNGKPISHALKQATVSLGSFYRRLGRYHETRILVEQAMGDKDVSPAVRNILANMYCDQGELAKAEELYNTVLTSLGKPLPEGDDERLDVTTLGFTYWTQDDKLTEDGLAYEGIYTTDLHQFDPWFASVLSTYNGLGVLYMKVGRLSTAEKLFKQALEGREKAMGPDTSFTAEIINHLGALYTRNGQYDQAEEYLRRALNCLERAFGPDYTTTQLATHNLGILRLQQNRLRDAEELILRTTEFLNRSFGPIHGITLSAFHNQALLFRSQGRVGEAKQLLEKTIVGWRQSGEGDAKPEADSQYCLAELFEISEDKRDEAQDLFRKAANLYSHALGEDHPQTKQAFERADAAHNNAGHRQDVL
ncbi:MAG: hypothetical protein Q9171_003885 [Xanthocarpia ochracea]